VGYDVAIDRPAPPPTASSPKGEEPREFSVERKEDGTTLLVEPVGPEIARVRFDTTRVSPVVGVYVLLAFVAAALAGLLGSRIGAAFSDDVALATREIKSTGAADVIRGTRIPRGARFATIATLMGAIDELGGDGGGAP